MGGQHIVAIFETFGRRGSNGDDTIAQLARERGIAVWKEAQYVTTKRCLVQLQEFEAKDEAAGGATEVLKGLVRELESIVEEKAKVHAEHKAEREAKRSAGAASVGEDGERRSVEEGGRVNGGHSSLQNVVGGVEEEAGGTEAEAETRGGGGENENDKDDGEGWNEGKGVGEEGKEGENAAAAAPAATPAKRGGRGRGRGRGGKGKAAAPLTT